MPHRTMNLDEVSDFLHLGVLEVLELVRKQEIPFEKQGRNLIFRRLQIETWASTHVMTMNHDRLHAYHQGAHKLKDGKTNPDSLLAQLLKPTYIQTNLHARTRSSVIREMCDLAISTGRVHIPADLIRAIEAREEHGSTGLAGGVALLHPEVHEPWLFDGSFVVMARCAQSVPFGAPDGRTTDLFFLLCISDEGLHLKTLSRICMICHRTSALAELRECQSDQDMYEVLLERENEVILCS